MHACPTVRPSSSYPNASDSRMAWAMVLVVVSLQYSSRLLVTRCASCSIFQEDAVKFVPASPCDREIEKVPEASVDVLIMPELVTRCVSLSPVVSRFDPLCLTLTC